MYVTNLSRVTLCVTTATSQGDSEGQQAAAEPQDNNHTGGLPQPAGVRLPPADANNLKGGGPGELHPQQHGEVHQLLP